MSKAYLSTPDTSSERTTPVEATSHRESAKILPFPLRGRVRLATGRQEARPGTNAVSPRVADAIAISSGWYHDAAIEADRLAAKR